MKKTLAILSILALTACGSGSNNGATTDSTAAQVDSAAVSAIDSTTAQIPVDSVTTSAPLKEGKTEEPVK
jgi:hypothetical protein